MTPLGPRLLLPVRGRGAHLADRGVGADLVPRPRGVRGRGDGRGGRARWSRRGEVAWTPLLLLAVAGGWILLVTRMVSFGAMLAAPLFVVAVTEILPRRTQAASGGRTERRAVWGGALLCLVGLTVAVPHTAAEPGGVPSAFASRLQQLPDGCVGARRGRHRRLDRVGVPRGPPGDRRHARRLPGELHPGLRGLPELQPGWQRFVARSGARVAVMRARIASDGSAPGPAGLEGRGEGPGLGLPGGTRHAP